MGSHITGCRQCGEEIRVSTSNEYPVCGECAKKLVQPKTQEDAIMAERAKVYGTVQESFDAIAKCWSAQLSMANGCKVRVRPEDVALCMAQLKAIRSSKVYHEDNYVDGVNYFRIAEELAVDRTKEEHDG